VSMSIREARAAQDAEVDGLNAKIEQLRVAYDRFFMGLERVPPARERAALEREIRLSPLHRAQTTATKFRFQGIQQRFATYRTYWDRVMRMIEEGTFRRELPDRGGTEGEAGARPKSGRAPDEDTRLRELYEAWSEARQAVGARSRVDFEKFRAKMEATKRRHREHFGCRDVDYAVKVKDGKVALTARPIY